MKSFKDKVAVITGAGSGIGQALAVALARQGARTALVDCNQGGLEETAGVIRDSGATVRCYRVDVSNREQVYRLAADVLRDFGQVDILINNAGVMTVPRAMDTISDEEFERVFAVNFWGAFYGMRAFLPTLRERPEACIVNVCSLAGLVGLVGYGPYGTSKWAMRGFSEMLQMELAGSSVQVTVVYPGGVKTNILRNASGFESDEHRDTTHRFFQRMSFLTPETVATRILRAIQRRSPRVLIGPDARFLSFLYNILPPRGKTTLSPVMAMLMGPPKRN